MSQPPDGKGIPERQFCYNCGILFGGEGTAYVHNVNVKLGNLRTAQIRIAIATIDSVPYVLGREGFLAQFDLKTDQNSGVFCIGER